MGLVAARRSAQRRLWRSKMLLLLPGELLERLLLVDPPGLIGVEVDEVDPWLLAGVGTQQLAHGGLRHSIEDSP